MREQVTRCNLAEDVARSLLEVPRNEPTLTLFTPRSPSCLTLFLFRPPPLRSTFVINYRKGSSRDPRTAKCREKEGGGGGNVPLALSFISAVFPTESWSLSFSVFS